MVVHFPIALLIVALFLELLSSKGRQTLRDGVTFLVGIGAFFALVSALCGWLLHQTEAYSGDWVDYHKWTGIGTAVLATTAFLILKKREGSRNLFRGVLSLSVICLMIAGHLGSGLTHGKEYLTEVLPWNQPADTNAAAQESLIYLAAFDSESEVPIEKLDELNLQVRAIFAHRCYKCHSSEKQKGELVLDTEEGVMLGGETGEILVPGDAEASDIIRRIELLRSDDDAMPSKGNLLGKSEILLIRKWIDLGAHWTDQRLKIFPEAEMALSRPALPSDTDHSNPIDQLLDDYLKTNRLEWNSTISDALFLRRASLDVTGLLPSPDRITAFEEDNRVNKRELLVDELLSEDHAYTQHWLSFWNDLLRNDYSGTGFITGGRKQITEWLYESLLANKSYDQMVKELLNPSERSEGFIKGIRWRGTVNNSQSTEMQAAQNISQSLLGVNMKCASCHNSFVSNLTLDEAYGFASIFADSTMEIHRCDVPTGRLAEPAFLYPELGEVDAATLKERLEQLASVVVQPANGRLYRTVVNRVWAQLFGRGIISPVDEMDKQPWNQELLDWLASDFIDQGYDLKTLLKQIISSDAYQLSSVEYESIDEVRSQEFVFEGPLRRRLSAEQFADALNQIKMPVYHGVAFDPQNEDFDAKWIWHPEIEVDRNVLPKSGKRYLRYEFDLPRKAILSAKTLTTADHSFKMSLNEKLMASDNDWKKVDLLDLVGDLQAGKNVLALEVENEGRVNNPAGFIMQMRVVFEDSTQLDIVSNRTWKSTDTAPSSDWKKASFDDSSWGNARKFGNMRNKHWGQLLAFSYSRDPEIIPFARASLVQIDPFQKALGRPTRENVATSRDDRSTLLQALELTNGESFNQVIELGAKNWANSISDEEELIDQLFLSALTRRPTKKERTYAIELMSESNPENTMRDLLWAMLMLPEFQLIF